ncbi:hypothetical protein BCU94_18490 [Shewanella sp. 10N.286.52.C2]|uniref:hypothetical protein n=1 Tax=Shewanella sp. 10N.286.52.C2 TaxID=1880838 RepID=UPI000C84F516|nr:hypothetical protein [Shewanella sp. 10N.286.52.C2]PMG28019.1 hypothetical protein BCU94_18490 [Shewanella sp. 10N.286.52.C2]
MANQQINKESIDDILFGKEFLRLQTAIESEKEEPEKLKSAKDYYQVIKKHNESVIIENTENRDLGHCRLRLVVGEDLPKKVCFLRNGMLITDKLHGLMRFYNYKDFVAVFECLSEKGNALLREMEPPRHDDFEPERLTKEQQRIGKRALNNIKQWIKDMIKRHAQDPGEAQSTLDELSKFLGSESSEAGEDKNEEMNPVGEIRITAKPVKRKKISAPFISETQGPGAGEGEQPGGGGPGNGGGGPGNGGGGPGNGGEGSGEVSTSGGKENITPVPLKNVRVSSNKSGNKSIFFTPLKTASLRIRVFLAGADSDYPTEITSANIGELKNGLLYLDGVANTRVTAEISINDDSGFAIKVVADEV